MKDYYHKGHISCVVLMVPEDPTAWTLITHVHTLAGYRRKGYARQLMMQVIRDADKEERSLALSVQPDGTENSSDFDTLKAWYGRLGFEMQDDEATMVRNPSRT